MSFRRVAPLSLLSLTLAACAVSTPVADVVSNSEEPATEPVVATLPAPLPPPTPAPPPIRTETLAITVAPGVTVRVPRIETASDVKELKTPLAKRFSVGASCGALTVLTSDIARKKMTCTLRSLSP